MGWLSSYFWFFIPQKNTWVLLQKKPMFSFVFLGIKTLAIFLGFDDPPPTMGGFNLPIEPSPPPLLTFPRGVSKEETPFRVGNSLVTSPAKKIKEGTP